MHPNQKIKFIDWYLKKDPPMLISADFECMIVPMQTVEYTKKKLFVSKPIAMGFNIV